MPRKKKLILITGGILLLVLVLGVYFIIFPRIEDSSITSVISAAGVLPYLNDGDVILRMSDAAWSEVFSNFSTTDNRFSHLGIVRIRGGTITIIHSLGSIRNRTKGVEETSLDAFLEAANAIGIFRVQSVEGSIISDTVMEYLGRPFDWSFDLNDDSRIYCTELLYVVLKKTGLEHLLSTIFLERINREVIPLDSISNSPHFIKIQCFP